MLAKESILVQWGIREEEIDEIEIYYSGKLAGFRIHFHGPSSWRRLSQHLALNAPYAMIVGIHYRHDQLRLFDKAAGSTELQPRS